MRRKAGALMVAFLGGCVSLDGGPETGGGGTAPWAKSGGRPPAVPGVAGPHGESIAMAAPYSYAPPSPWNARAMMNSSVPLNMVAQHQGGLVPPAPGLPPMAMPPGLIGPPGLPMAPGAPGGMAAMPGMPPM